MNKTTVKIEIENAKELVILGKLGDMQSFMFELTHNFWRKWKHDDSGLNVDTLREELSNLLLHHGLSPGDFEY